MLNETNSIVVIFLSMNGRKKGIRPIHTPWPPKARFCTQPTPVSRSENSDAAGTAKNRLPVNRRLELALLRRVGRVKPVNEQDYFFN